MPTASIDNRRTGARAGAQAGLEVLLTDAAVGRGTRRFIQPRAAAAVGAGVARHPLSVARRASALGGELARVAAGRSQQAPVKGDRRFGDEAWEKNWLLRRVMQGYLAVGESVDGVISDAQLDWQTERQARFAASNVLDALAPTNFPWSNPAVLRAIVDEGGANLVRGGRRFAADVSWPPRLPQSVDTEGFEVGGNLAVSPGSVVLRTEVFELIQYKPTHRGGARGAAAVRPADDQQVLHPGSRAGAQHGRVPRGVRPAGLRRLLAQPRRGAGALRPRHLRRRRDSRRARPSPRSRASARCTSTPRARAGSSAAGRSGTSPPRGRSGKSRA